jgi:hypothetical protein
LFRAGPANRLVSEAETKLRRFAPGTKKGLAHYLFAGRSAGPCGTVEENNAMKELLARLVLLLFIVGITKGVVEDKNPTVAKPPGGGARQADDFQPSR